MRVPLGMHALAWLGRPGCLFGRSDEDAQINRAGHPTPLACSRCEVYRASFPPTSRLLLPPLLLRAAQRYARVYVRAVCVYARTRAPVRESPLPPPIVVKITHVYAGVKGGGRERGGNRDGKRRFLRRSAVFDKRRVNTPSDRFGRDDDR